LICVSAAQINADPIVVFNCRWWDGRCIQFPKQIRRTALELAAGLGRSDSVRLLLESGADMENKNNVRQIINLHAICHLFDAQYVQYFLAFSRLRSLSPTVKLALTLNAHQISLEL
jgi:hypothetical protein